MPDGEALPTDNYRWLVLITVVFGAFASILDATIVNTALPRIQHDFGADLHVASYVVTGYILAAGVVVPASGFLANRFGTKRVYLISLVLFTLGSAVCGAAPSIHLLIAARVLQGAGGAALFPLSFAMLFSVFPNEERGKANGIFGIPILAAPALGPSLGGYLTQYADWRWVFYVNLPESALLGVVLGWKVLREIYDPPRVAFPRPAGVSPRRQVGWACLASARRTRILPTMGGAARSPCRDQSLLLSSCWQASWWKPCAAHPRYCNFASTSEGTIFSAV